MDTQTPDATPATSANPRQQIVDIVKNNNNILVTVSTNPSVDELSAALGLTILLNNLGKRGTAVVSGQIPPAIEFLEPGKTFENTTDSLRDFIIALDKEKADHLRYKVDGDVVKIFITPYRTLLSDKDLEFSLGDYNVEAVIALGVQDQDHLDKALDSHGAILHDAAVATITAGETVSTLGGINWQDQTASSLCEMLVSLSEALKEDKPLLDEQTSTAFLTGIVSATDRFSNDHTTSRIMTMAAQLMAAGANQQLIAAKLEEAHEIGPNSQLVTNDDQIAVNADGTTSLAEGAAPMRVEKGTKTEQTDQPQDGLLIEIDHPEEVAPAETEQEAAPVADVPAPEEVSAEPATPVEAPEAVAAETAEEALARELAEVVPPAAPAPEAISQELATNGDIQQQTDSSVAPAPEAPASADSSALPQLDFEALLPKTPTQETSAPPEPSADIATHAEGSGYVGGQAAGSQGMNGAAQADPESAPVDPFAAPLVSPNLPPLQPDPLFAAQQTTTAPVAPTIMPPHAPDEIQYEESPIPNDPAAVAAVPDFAAMNPTGLAAPPPPPVPSEASATPSLDNLPPLPPLPPLPNLAPDAPPPPLPDLSLPQAPPADGQPPAPPAPSPGQFTIPGQ